MLKWLLPLVVLLTTISSACAAPLPTITPPPTTPTQVAQTAPELKYLLIARYGGVFYCDPDYYPIAREGQEQKNALEQFAAIRANSAEFSAILQNLGLPGKADYTADEKLAIYREHKKLTLGVELTASGNIYNYVLRIGEGQGNRIEGTVTQFGDIKELKKEASFNTCPICLAKGTLIDTPSGALPVEQLKQGMSIWTADDSGSRVVAIVAKTATTPVPQSFRMVKVSLGDGRTVTASPGHPSAEGKALGNYSAGDMLDGAQVDRVEYVPYEGSFTYDILPSGKSGVYWANGIPLKSTLAGS